jgi:hypothetical protein
MNPATLMMVAATQKKTIPAPAALNNGKKSDKHILSIVFLLKYNFCPMQILSARIFIFMLIVKYVWLQILMACWPADQKDGIEIFTRNNSSGILAIREVGGLVLPSLCFLNSQNE